MRGFCCAILLAVTAFAQPELDHFEVASIHVDEPWHPGVNRACTGGPETNDPEVYRCTAATITQLATIAYAVPFYRLKAENWMQTDDYDIVAKVAPGATKAQLRMMLQNLLTDRFHAVIRHETKNAPGYTLRVNSGGPYIKPIQDSSAAPDFALNSVQGHWQLIAKHESMKALAGYLNIRVWASVTDETGLTGIYDFTLDFAPDGVPASSTDVPDLFEALRAQLGLRLDTKTAPADFVIIDRADKAPSEN